METSPLKKDRILIVDDTPLNLDVLSTVLKPHYKVMAARNGHNALRAARAAKRPDLILLDIMMPEMDGYEVCRRLKDDPETRDIPVIFVTALGETEDETKGFELGAVDYITKPISPPIVLARVKTHLCLKHNLEELQKAYDFIEIQKNRMEDELNVGRRIQMNMVPRQFPPFPQRPEFSIFATLQPANEVGGDLYDFYFVDEHRLCFCLGDVSGKGVPAALFMAMVKTLLKSRARGELSTAQIIDHVNDYISQDNEDCMFVTLFLAILDIRSGELVYTNAGHNPPYLLSEQGEPKPLGERHGPAVGPIEGLKWQESRLGMQPGDMLLLYTDGVTEAQNPQNELFGDERLKQKLASGQYPNVQELVAQTVQAAKEFEAGAHQADDITLLAVQYLGPQS